LNRLFLLLHNLRRQKLSAPATEAKAITLPTFVGEERYIEKPVNQMRKTIAASSR
jgi:hypothetical protein